MPISKEEILTEIHKVVAANDGEIPGERTFIAATRIKTSTWKDRYWIRWTDAIREAGYDPNSMQRKIPDEDVLTQLASLIAKLGYFPVRDEINMHARMTPGLPHWTTIKNRYGGMAELAAALVEFSRQNSNTVLEAICQARLEMEAVKPAPIVLVQREMEFSLRGISELKGDW